ncbi:MAG: tRNA uridine-5-carboxymethylaminomethyl(34) synthesis enzyme MnmG [Bacteroidales bacterium]|jgi:tRNA uridine 5-carboxymethylaminomethyl modification enzyme|nr:tRNA uridine-5-carboxymethylaminomethyl(34) synthesis enzyme MnmG [Bacteroidales bacterium]MCI1732841.1 tRNA uridine-5-carboxymethylaminomethyl(34) synthesis enzyme MnmG [Bacteroidales bacterium]
MVDNKYDIIVIGAGHAGCEACCAAAKMGFRTLLITMDMNKIAQMSCNPAVGGVAKGQIVREIDALGGSMGLVTDASTIQFRMLNSSKGPAVWSPRAQCDRMFFVLNWRFVLEHTPNLFIWQDIVNDLDISRGKVTGVKTSMGAHFSAKKVIITAGTFLHGKLFIGLHCAEGGRIGEPTAVGLTEKLSSAGIQTDRMKTGTPPRIDIKSVDLNKLEKQPGDDVPSKFSFLNVPSSVQLNVPQMSCYMVHTNPEVHEILKKGFKYSPLFTGLIHGKGPRYCPSIEDKVRTFAGKPQHQLFLEPEGWNTHEYYLQGFSSSLPMQVQVDAMHHIKGLESAEIFRPAYAVEYDYFPPTQLYNSLESRKIKGLYFAGQVNGTTGYEEAAAQGLIAGINAALSLRDEEPLILKRDESYIGVLIDDLVTKGVDEPYRMFTSRAEYRILLRQDNADFRLTPYGYKIGLATSGRMKLMEAKYSAAAKITDYFDTNNISPKMSSKFLDEHNSSPLSEGKKISALLTRPNISLSALLKIVPRGTKVISPAKELDGKYSATDEILNNPAKRLSALSAKKFTFSFPYRPAKISLKTKQKFQLSDETLQSVEIAIKYRGYIEREKLQADKMHRLEGMKIPAKFDYTKVYSLSTEGRQKLILHQPATIAQASRIPGVSPSDISVLLIFFGRG